ncbi:hypothetical protein [Streptomyces olivaceiscleroticus]
MPRAKRDDELPDVPDEAAVEPEQAPAAAPAPEPRHAPAQATGDDSPFEPYPGEHFFHGGRTSPIIRAMAGRLTALGHVPDGVSLGADWTNSHLRAFAAFQHELRPKDGGDTSGIPDEVAWNRLQVPRVSPRTTRNSEASA